MCGRNSAAGVIDSQVRPSDPSDEGEHLGPAALRRYNRAVRGGIAALVFVFVLVAVPPAGATSRQPASLASMTVTASPAAASAHPTRLTLTLRYEMQCGYPGAGPLVVRFPPAVRLPKRFAAGAVRLLGKPIAATRAGRQVTVTIGPPSGQLCTLLGPGSVKLVFTRKARLANPKRAGSYRFTAMHGKHTFTSKLAIRPAG